MDHGIEKAFASALGVLAITRIFFDVGDHAGVENAFAIVRGIKATIEVEVGSTEIYTHLCGHLFQRFQAFTRTMSVALTGATGTGAKT